MKQLILVAFISISTLGLFADDSAVEVAGGSPSTANMTHEFDIQMVNENISITLLKDFYRVSARFEFRNFGHTKTIDVGFPQWQRGTMDHLDITDFVAKVNGEPVKVSTSISDTRLGKIGVHINKWFVRSITFPSNEVTISEISYKVPYGLGTGAEYLYGTGATWKGQIENIHVEISNESEKWINWIETGDVQTVDLVNDGDIIRFDLNNIEPNADALVMFGSDPVPLGLTGPRIPNPKRDWYYALHTFSQTDLRLLTVSQLRIVRNLILAAHGQVFQSSDLKEWFQTYCNDWYRPTGQVDPSSLGPKELQNLGLIQVEEARRKGK